MLKTQKTISDPQPLVAEIHGLGPSRLVAPTESSSVESCRCLGFADRSVQGHRLEFSSVINRSMILPVLMRSAVYGDYGRQGR